MKALVIAGVILASTSVFARKDDQWIRYQCMAAGSKNGARVQAQGWERDTVPQARVSAVKVCSSRGISGCAVTACYERVWGN